MKTKQSAGLLAIARIGKVFGVRGEVKIFSYSRTVDEYKNISALFRGNDEANVVPCEIESVKNRGDEIYVKLKGIDDRTQAEMIVGQYLFVDESERKKLPPGKFFHDDLIGCAVVSESGKRYGVVKEIQQFPAHKIYVVRTDRGDVLLPAVEEFIRSVDLTTKKIVVRPPEGLFDGEMIE